MPANRFFIQGVLIALILSLSGWILFWTLIFYFPSTTSIRLLTAVVVCCYLLFLTVFKHSGRSFCSGRVASSGLISFYTLYLLLSISMLSLAISLPGIILFQLFSIWLFRSVFYQKYFMAMLFDGVLVLLSLVLTFYIVLRTQNIFLTLWSFFLLQSLWIFIPVRCRSVQQFISKLSKKQSSTTNYSPDSLTFAFDEQQRTANKAFLKLAEKNQIIHLTQQQVDKA